MKKNINRSESIEILHRRFFSGVKVPPTNKTIRNFLRDIDRSPALRAFSVYVIGSILNSRRTPRDIDILILPRNGDNFLGVAEIELALLACMEIGKNNKNLNVDPVYRPDNIDDRLIDGQLFPDSTFESIRLEDPSCTFRIASGWDKEIRPLGSFCIAQNTQASSTKFYKKLLINDNVSTRKLAPAVPVLRFLESVQRG